MFYLPWFNPLAGPSSLPFGGPESACYDLSLLSLEDRQALLKQPDLRASFLVVAPNRSLCVYADAAACAERMRGVDCLLCVAGIGSSLAGAAAFAKALMQSSGMPVIALVTHYSLINLQAGWARMMMSSLSADAKKAAQDYLVPTEQDCLALSELLALPQMKIRMLVGHSRGAWLIRETLNQVSSAQSRADFEVVTLGGVASFPAYLKVRQYLGSMDWIGKVFSEPGVAHEIVMGAGHHLSPMLPGRLNPDLARPNS